MPPPQPSFESLAGAMLEVLRGERAREVEQRSPLAQLQIEITGPQPAADVGRVFQVPHHRPQHHHDCRPVHPGPQDRPAPARKEALNALNADFSTRLTGYRQELGENALTPSRPSINSPLRAACRGLSRVRLQPRPNTLTDVAARPPDISCFQQTRDAI